MRRTAPTRVATADAHRDVEPLLHQVDRPIDQAERDRHVGETVEELGHDRQHMQAPEQDRRGDAQFAARRGTPPAAARSISSKSASTRRAPARNRSPASVRLTARVVRLRSRTPSRVSNSPTARVTAAAERASRRATAVKLRRSATSTKIATLSMRPISIAYIAIISCHKGILQSEMKRSTSQVVIAIRTHIP
jgi:hypothetical protein